MNISVLDAGTLGFDKNAWSDFLTLGDLSIHDHTSHDSSSITSAIGNADVVLTNKVPLNAQTLGKLPHLKLISVLATGYDIIDMKAAAANNITVCNVPGYSTNSTAQHTVALILECCNQVGRHSQSVHQGDWVKSPFFSYWLQSPRELNDLKVGFIGLGKIGKRVGEIMNAMGAQILAYTPTQRNTPQWSNFQWSSIEHIFKEADIVSLHCPQTTENFQFVNPALLSSMKPTSFLINTARGTLVDEAALAEALANGNIAGAAMDVLSNEPMHPKSPLLNAPNCIITPHLAWASETSRLRLLATTRKNLSSFKKGNTINRVY